MYFQNNINPSQGGMYDNNVNQMGMQHMSQHQGVYQNGMPMQMNSLPTMQQQQQQFPYPMQQQQQLPSYPLQMQQPLQPQQHPYPLQQQSQYPTPPNNPNQFFPMTSMAMIQPYMDR